MTHKVNGKSRRDDVVMQEKKRLLAERRLSRWADWPNVDKTKPTPYELVQARCLDWLERRAEQAGFRVLTRELHDDEHSVHVEKSVRVDGYTKHQAEVQTYAFLRWILRGS